MTLIPVPMTGGVNLFTDPRRMRPDELLRAKNVFPSHPGIFAKRGAAQYAESLGNIGEETVSDAFFYTNMMFNPSQVGADFVLTGRTGLDTDVLYAGQRGGGGLVLSQTLSGAAPSERQRPLFVAYGDKIYCFAGYAGSGGEVGWVVQPTAGYAGVEIARFNFSSAQATTSAPKVVGVYRNRMVFGNFGKGYETHFTFADPDVPTTVSADFLAANGNNFTLPAAAGDKLVAFIEITQSAVGTPSQSALLILCERTAFILNGEPLFTIDTPDPAEGYAGDVTLSQISEPCGCVSADTVVRTPYGLVWAGTDDVWGFQLGQLPVRIGTKIRPAIENTQPDQRWRWFAAYHGGAYRLALPGEGQNPTADEPLSDQWWLDLRDGIPQDWPSARWWGPHQYNIARKVTQYNETQPTPPKGLFFMAREQRAGKEVGLFTVTNAVAGVYTSGMSQLYQHHHVLIELDVPVTYDSALTRDASDLDYAGIGLSAPQNILEMAESNNEIQIEIVTRDYSAIGLGRNGALIEEPGVEKLWLGVELDVWNGYVGRMTDELFMDGGEQYETSSKDMEVFGFLMDVDSLESSQRMTKKYQQILIPRDADNSLVGKTYQVKLYDSPGYVITDQNKYFCFTNAAASTTYTATLTEGFYADIHALLTEVTTRMNAVWTGAGTFAVVTTKLTGKQVYQFAAINNASATWRIAFLVIGSGLTAAQRKSTRMIGAVIGFDTSTDPTAANQITGVSSPRPKLAIALEIGETNLRIEPSGRRAS